MRLGPALIQHLVQVAADAAAAGYGGKEAIYAAGAAHVGIGRATLMRYLKEVTVHKQRKQRSDAGVTSVPMTMLHLVAATMMEGFRANNKKIMTVRKALKILESDGKIPRGRVDQASGEIVPWSDSTVLRALRLHGLHPDQLRLPTPATPQKSAHPNDVWQIDASISTLFYVPESGLADMSPAVFYKNKPGNFEKIKRQRLTRYVITDHCSGAIFVHYVAGGESVVNMTDSLLRCIEQRPGHQMYGAPFHLMMDPGGENAATRNLLTRLLIEPIVNSVGNARAKGQVECAHNIVECDFESGFKFAHVPDIDWINTQAARWMLWYNSTKIHSRHGLTRWQKWVEIAAEQLRVVPAGVDLRNLVFGKPIERTVDQWCNIELGGAWKVGHVPNVMIGQKLEVVKNPFNPDSLFVVDVQGGYEVLIALERVVLDANGFPEHAAHIAREFKAPPDTVLDTNRKLIERLVTGAATDEAAKAARKAKTLPFGTGLDAYKYLDEVPDVPILPRRGTALDVATRTAAAPDRTLNHFEVARALVALGVAMDAEKNRQVAGWYPDGVPESELAALQHRLTMRAGLKVVGAD